MDQSQISRYETGRYKQLKADQIQRIAKALGYSVDTLLGGAGEEEAQASKRTVSTASPSLFTPKRLKQAMKAANMNAAELARTCQIGESNIARYLKGTRKPTRKVLDLMADALKVASSDLLDGKAKSSVKTSPPETVGQRLDRIMLAANMTGADLARMTGVGEATINKLRRGYHEDTSFSSMMKICKALGISPYDLLGQSAPQEPPMLQQTLPLEGAPGHSLARQDREAPEPPDADVIRRIAALQGYVETQRPLSHLVNSQEWRMRDFLDATEHLSASLRESQAQIATLQSVVVNAETRFSALASIVGQIAKHVDLPATIQSRIRSLIA